MGDEVGIDARQWEATVLVDVGKLGQYAEPLRRFGIVRVVPCVIRLKPLRECSCSLWEEPHHAPLAVAHGLHGSELVGLDVERKLGAPCVRRGVQPRSGDVQGIGKVIKGAPDVVDALADPDVPLSRDAGVSVDQDEDSPLWVALRPDSEQIGYGAPLDFPFEFAQPLLCPAELGKCTPQHALPSPPHGRPA